MTDEAMREAAQKFLTAKNWSFDDDDWDTVIDDVAAFGQSREQAAYLRGRREGDLELYASVTKTAMQAGQVVGEKSEYYITLAQLESAIRAKLAEEETK